MDIPVTISDLKELDKNDADLSPQQRLAIKNFDRYRFKILTGIRTEDKFHLEFQRLQSLSKLTDFQEFLKDEYL